MTGKTRNARTVQTAALIIPLSSHVLSVCVRFILPIYIFELLSIVKACEQTTPGYGQSQSLTTHAACRSFASMVRLLLLQCGGFPKRLVLVIPCLPRGFLTRNYPLFHLPPFLAFSFFSKRKKCSTAVVPKGSKTQVREKKRAKQASGIQNVFSVWFPLKLLKVFFSSFSFLIHCLPDVSFHSFFLLS